METNEGIGNKISSKIVRSSGVYDVFLRVRKYCDDYGAYLREYGVPPRDGTKI